MMPGTKCSLCDTVYTGGTKNGSWWNCNGYYGFSGFFCPTCYSMISHNAYGKPQDPEGYLLMSIKMGITGNA